MKSLYFTKIWIEGICSECALPKKMKKSKKKRNYKIKTPNSLQEVYACE